MQDRPTTMELLEAVREFLEREVLPALTVHGLKYRTRIALNLLRIVEREIPGREARVREASHELCERIRAGAADAGPWRARVLAHVGAIVEEKLAINDPQRLEALSRGAGPGSPP